MTIRFLQTTPSMNPERPFQPGQIIHLTKLTPELRTWIKLGHAELVREDPEKAVEKAVTR